jgi:DNA polymerase theta
MYFQLYQTLSTDFKRVADMVGIVEAYLFKACSKAPPHGDKSAIVHRRYFSSLILCDLVNETPVWKVSKSRIYGTSWLNILEYGIVRGSLQSLQTLASSFAGMISAFCSRLGWNDMEVLVAQVMQQ